MVTTFKINSNNSFIYLKTNTVKITNTNKNANTGTQKAGEYPL